VSAPQVKVSGQGILILAVMLIGGYLVYKAIKGIGALNGLAEDAGNAIAGALVPDANAAVQSNFQQFMAAWKAAGSPPTGSPAELALRQKYGIPPPPASQIGTGGSSSS
jgi:hypothetical protein